MRLHEAAWFAWACMGLAWACMGLHMQAHLFLHGMVHCPEVAAWFIAWYLHGCMGLLHHGA